MKRLWLCFVLALFAFILCGLSVAQQPVIPRTWDTQAIESLQLPLADPRLSKRQPRIRT
jgi:hypothetical protein